MEADYGSVAMGNCIQVVNRIFMLSAPFWHLDPPTAFSYNLRVKKKLVLYILLLHLSSLIMADSGITKETLQFVFSSFPPFEYMDNGTPVGMNIEIVKEACRRLNVEPLFRQIPWKRALGYVRTGEADAVFSLFINEERRFHYNYPEENLNSVKMILITNIESGFSVNRLEDLKGKRVGVYLGSSYGEEFDDSDWIIKDQANSNEGLLRMQSVGRTDVIVMDERVAQYWSHEIDLKGRFKTLEYVVTQSPTYVAFSKVTAERTGIDWAVMFSETLKEMREEGFMDALEVKYLF